MRLLGSALVVVACLCSLAVAKPRKTPAAKPASTAPAKGAPPAAGAPKPGKQATPQQTAELAKLDQELTAHQMKQAHFAALKVAKQLYELQRKATGEESPETQRRKQTLAGIMQTTADYSGAEKLYREILKQVEKDKGPDSREVLYALMPVSGSYWAQSRYDDLEPLLKRQIELTKKLDGEQERHVRRRS